MGSVSVITGGVVSDGSGGGSDERGGNATRWERDTGGRVLREVRADGTTDTDYTYDALGRLTTVTDPKQQVTTYTYNLDGSVGMVAYTNAQIPTPGVTWTYDPAYPRVTSMVDGTGTTSYTYHPVGQLGAGQVATVDGPLANDVISYTYDPLGRVTTRAINGVPLTLTYDALGRVEREVNVLGTFDYTFDGTSSRPASVTYPNGQTSLYAYYPAAQDHRLQQILHRYPNGATLSQFDYTYDAVGNIQTWRQQADTTAVMWDYGYDNADQLNRAVKRATDPQGTVLQRFAYGYDPAGNRLFEQTDDTVTAWTHDRLNRLVTQQAGGVLRVAGTVNEAARVTVEGLPATVDASGVFVGGVQVAPGTTRFTVTATDASGNVATQSYDVDQVGPPKSFTFDANGNMTSDGTRTFEWDARNQLMSVTVGTHRSEFTYDGQQRRVRLVEKENSVVQSDSKLIWCQTAICEERAADGMSIARRLLAQGEQVAGVPRFFPVDHLGSVGGVTDSTSTLLAGYAFDPWGRRTVTTGTDITNLGYTGHRWDVSSGLALTMYRAYAPELGRWISEDPLGLVDGPNVHAYVGNNPLSSGDLLGLSARIRCEQIKGKGWRTDVLLKFANARHCFLEVECPGKYHLTLEIYGPQAGFPNGKPMNQPFNPDRARNTTSRPVKDACPENCDFEDQLIKSFETQSQNLPPYGARGPNSNTFVRRVIEGAGGIVPRFPGGAYGWDYR